jgi:S-adenosylmethionine hydrolase
MANITLLTDFGTADYFVPAMKGIILSINPQAIITDITHDIPAHDILAGAFTLGACWQNFPTGTIHLAVIDPGVGSDRRIIIVEAGNHLFVGPDNGVFGCVYANASIKRVFHVTRSDIFRHSLSATFHGRDVFAPLAAHLSLRDKPETLGTQIENYHRGLFPAPQINHAENVITACIIHIDHFGNCITNLTTRGLPVESAEHAQIMIGETEINRFGTHYAQATDGELFAYVGSAGYWEIAIWQESAADRLKVSRGAEVTVRSSNQR